MQDEDEVRTRVRQRYGAIARETASCCGPSCCAPEMAPDGLNVIGDAYQGVAGHVAEADLNLGCGVPTQRAALKRASKGEVLTLSGATGRGVTEAMSRLFDVVREAREASAETETAS